MREPVERLNRKIGAGGRRRARREEQHHGQRAQRGKRPKGARAERKQDSQPSRRRANAERRQHKSSRAATKPNSNPAQATLTRSEEAQAPGSFQAHLSSKGEKQVQAGRAQVPGSKASAATDTTPIVSSLPQSPLQPLNTPLRGTELSGPGPAPLAVGSGANNGQHRAAQVAPTATASGDRPEQAHTETTKSSSASAMQEKAEAQEAQRSTQVLRQLRMQLHPGMRSMSIQLAPATLGRLSVRMRVKDDEVHAVLRAESEETLAVLERHIPELEAAFGDQGFEKMTFEFVLDQHNSPDAAEWRSGRDASRELQALIEDKIDPALRGAKTLTDIAVDTYA